MEVAATYSATGTPQSQLNNRFYIFEQQEGLTAASGHSTSLHSVLAYIWPKTCLGVIVLTADNLFISLYAGRHDARREGGKKRRKGVREPLHTKEATASIKRHSVRSDRCTRVATGYIHSSRRTTKPFDRLSVDCLLLITYKQCSKAIIMVGTPWLSVWLFSTISR